jgi:hypothetical protein
MTAPTDVNPDLLPLDESASTWGLSDWRRARLEATDIGVSLDEYLEMPHVEIERRLAQNERRERLRAVPPQ